MSLESNLERVLARHEELGSLLAQGMELESAAGLGVMLHAMAADQAAEQGERGLLATDLLPRLRALVNPCQHLS